MTQKHIALFSQAEVWTDYRRTGFPVLASPANGAIGPLIPRRLPYPLDERSYNGAQVPAGRTLGGKGLVGVVKGLLGSFSFKVSG